MPNTNGSKHETLLHIDAPKIIAVITLIAAVMVSSPHFVSPRPPVKPVRIQTSGGFQKFYLSIQEDPFQILDINRESKETSGFTNLWTQPPTNVSAFLAVMVPGGSSSEDHEARIRARQAISAAMMELDYGPDDPDHIGIWGGAVSNSFPLPIPIPIPFEYYHEKNSLNSSNGVVVLWLNEDEFRADMVKKLWTIRQQRPDRRFHLVGPYSSERLRQLLEEIESMNASVEAKTNGWSSIALALPRASSAALMGEADTTQLESVRASVLDELVKNNMVFSNAFDLAVNDAVLAHKAWHEFKARGVDLDLETKNHLLIVSDATTLIGRSLPKLFSNVLQNRGPNFPNRPKVVGMGQPFPPNMHVFSYNANLDGGQGGRSGEEGGNGSQCCSGKKEESGETYVSSGKGNPAFGANQMDSLERLARAVGNLDSELRLQDRGAIRGVMVGGGDIYDTLLVLRALRSVLPYAVFMTTELDARLWDSQVWDYTHNLVVVSGYGLSLNPRLQKRSLPFRDSRQTALFAAATASLTSESFRNALGIQKGDVSNRDFAVPHQVFEISRTGPRELTEASTWNTRLPIHPDLGIHPTRPSLWLYTLAIVAILFVVGIGCLTISPMQWLIRAKYEHLAQPLWLTEDDLGGNRGVWHLRNLIPQYAGEQNSIKEQAELLGVLKEELNYLTAEEARNKNKDGTDLVAIHALDIIKPGELVDFIRGKPMQGMLEELKNIRGGDLIVPKQPTIDLPEGATSTPDLAIALNEMVEWLSNNTFFWEKVECLGKEGASGEKSEGLGHDEVVKFNPKAWDLLSPYIGSHSHSLTAESLNSHHQTPLASRNRLLFARQIVQAIFEPYLRPWSIEFVSSTRTVEIADAINHKLRNDPDSRTVNSREQFLHLRARRDHLYCALLMIAQKVYQSLDNSKLRKDSAGAKSPDESAATPSNPDGASISLKTVEGETSEKSSEARGSLDILKACLNSLWVGKSLTELRLYRLWLFRSVLFIGLLLIILLTCYSLFEASDINSHFMSGTSLAPTVFGLSAAIMLVIIFGVESVTQTKRAMLRISRSYRLPLRGAADPKYMSKDSELFGENSPCADGSASAFRVSLVPWLTSKWLASRLPAVPEHQSPVVAGKLWSEYRSKIALKSRVARIGIASALYFSAVIVFLYVLGNGYVDLMPLRAGWKEWVIGLSFVSVIAFVILAFTVLDSALICSWFIRSLTQGPTQYPDYTTKAVRDRYGLIDPQVVANYIDVKLIHEITEGIGKTLYYPAIVLSVILLAFNTITYTWPWPGTWYFVMAGHFAVAGAGVLALQKSARVSRDKCVDELDTMVNRQKLANSDSQAAFKDVLLSRAEELVDEVRNLRHGAFAGFFNNPVIGASLLPVASVLLIQLLQRMLQK